MAGHVFGGALLLRALAWNRSLWLFSIAGALWQLELLGAGPFGGGVPGLLVAGVGEPWRAEWWRSGVRGPC